MAENMAGTNEFAFFRCRSMRTGGGSRIRPKKHSKHASGRCWYENRLFQYYCVAGVRLQAVSFETLCKRVFGGVLMAGPTQSWVGPPTS